jgi:hypothetical protein
MDRTKVQHEIGIRYHPRPGGGQGVDDHVGGHLGLEGSVTG